MLLLDRRVVARGEPTRKAVGGTSSVHRSATRDRSEIRAAGRPHLTDQRDWCASPREAPLPSRAARRRHDEGAAYPYALVSRWPCYLSRIFAEKLAVHATPGRVTVHVGVPLEFEPATPMRQATATIEAARRAL
jgi:hypothetical protein